MREHSFKAKFIGKQKWLSLENNIEKCNRLFLGILVIKNVLDDMHNQKTVMVDVNVNIKM